jgi:hypothetical protein
MAVTLSLFAGAGAQFFDNNGNVLSGGKIYTYQAGTTTPLATYTTNSESAFHTNPIILDSAGRVPSGGEIWLQLGVGYKFVLRTSAEVLIATYDNIPSSAQPPAANDADSIMYEQGYTVTAGSFVVGKIYRIASVGTTNFTLIGAVNNTVGTHFIATGVGTGTGTAELSQTVETKLRETVSVKDFGAVGDGVTDDTAAIQAAIDAVFAANGGTVFFPSGVYISNPLILKFKVSLMGSCPQQLNEISSLVVGTQLKLKDSANAALITTDKVNGPIRGTPSHGVGPQRYQNSFITGIQFNGNKSNQTSPNADLIEVYQSWNTTIQNCSFFNVRGFGIRALDCNTLNIITNSFISAPIYCESIADSLISSNQLGGGNSYAWPVIWFAASQAQFAAWQNLVQDNFIFNNSLNVPSQTFTFTVDAATDTATTVGAHGWSDGTPVIVETTGTIPSGLSLSATYYVKVVNSTSIKFATTRANLAANVFVDITTAGTGTQTVQMGGNAGLYLSGSAVKWNKFAGNRLDQDYGHNILSSGAIENTFSDNIVNSAGLGNATGQYGISLINSSLRNQIVDNNIDGTVIASGGNLSNQTIGIHADVSSVDTIILGNRVQNNPVANVQVAAGYTETNITDSIFIPMKEFTAVTGTPAITLAGGGRRNVLAFDAASLETADAFIQIPTGWQSIAVEVIWANLGAGSGDVVWRVQGLARTAGETLDTADNTGGAGTTITAGAQNIVMVSAMSGNLDLINENYYLSVRVSRLGTDAGDTLANDAGLIGITLTRV